MAARKKKAPTKRKAPVKKKQAARKKRAVVHEPASIVVDPGIKKWWLGLATWQKIVLILLVAGVLMAVVS